MKRFVLFFVVLFGWCTASTAQAFTGPALFVIDSIPLLQNPEDWNPLMEDEIADRTTVKDKDSLTRLGYPNYGEVTYIFTKAYRNRPDSTRRIPSRKRMEQVNGAWVLNGQLYSGRYIDYYNSGRKLDEGTLRKGVLHGELITYFPNGAVRSVAMYKEGKTHGLTSEYYPNGALRMKRTYVDGRPEGLLESFFPNGQVRYKKIVSKRSVYDTTISYYSTGKIMHLSLIKNGTLVPDLTRHQIINLEAQYRYSMQRGETEQALDYCTQILQLDSTHADAYLHRGMALYGDFRFAEAIKAFDQALRIEPFLEAALGYRGLARIKKYQFANTLAVRKDGEGTVPVYTDTASLPQEEHQKVCSDLRRAAFLEYNFHQLNKQVADALAKYCEGEGSR